MNEKKRMLSEGPITKNLSNVSYDIKDGRIRARVTVTLCNGTRKRLQGQGSSKRAALNALRKNVGKENELIQYGEQKESGDITLIAAVEDLIHERTQEYDRTKGREARRDSSIARDQDSLKYLIAPSPIGKKKLTHIFCRDLDNYMRWLETAQYDRGRGKTHCYQYYSASSLNRALRLVKSVIDDFYKYRPEKSPTDVLHFFKQHVRQKTSEDFLTGEEFEREGDSRYNFFNGTVDMLKILHSPFQFINPISWQLFSVGLSDIEAICYLVSFYRNFSNFFLHRPIWIQNR